MDVILSKRCTVCAEVLPVHHFRIAKRKLCDGRASQCNDCENDRRRALRRAGAVKPGPAQWSAVEDGLIRSVYPGSGLDGVRGFLPGRSDASIRARACRLGVHMTASVYSHPIAAVEPLWAVPAHDYTPEDRAWIDNAWERPPVVYATGFGAAVIRAEVAL